MSPLPMYASVLMVGSDRGCRPTKGGARGGQQQEPEKPVHSVHRWTELGWKEKSGYKLLGVLLGRL